MSNVIPLGCITKLDIPVDRVLEEAKEKLDTCILIGYDKWGDLYFASTVSDGGDVLWLLEKAKQALMNVDQQEE